MIYVGQGATYKEHRYRGSTHIEHVSESETQKSGMRCAIPHNAEPPCQLRNGHDPKGIAQ